jgi:hypothetical protein
MANFFIYFVSPFILLGIVYLIWVYSANKLKDRFPSYYKLCGRINDNLPKIIAFVIIVSFLYYYWGIDGIRFQ